MSKAKSLLWPPRRAAQQDYLYYNTKAPLPVRALLCYLKKRIEGFFFAEKLPLLYHILDVVIQHIAVKRLASDDEIVSILPHVAFYIVLVAPLRIPDGAAKAPPVNIILKP
jgi:hypothetical protein